MAAGALCWTMVASVALSQEDLEPVQVGTPERIEVYPAEIKLTGPTAQGIYKFRKNISQNR